MSPIYVLDGYYLGITALVTIAMQLLFFAVAYGLQIDKVTDFAGTTNFILLALLTLFLGDQNDARSYLISFLVVVWGIRIAGFLFYRILKTGEDDRFDDLRGNFLKFLGFWIFQMFWVWTVSLPVTLTNSPNRQQINPELTAQDIIGIIIFAIGLVIETIADNQKFKFNNNRQDRLAIMNQGVWYYSRHPNYFGEIIQWWAIFLISLGSLDGTSETTYLWTGILSPLMTMALLLFLSGIPMSEPGKDKKIIEKGSQEQKTQYFEYLKRTSPLIPLPPSIYYSIPIFIKRTILFEFPFYRYNPSKAPLVDQDIS